MKNCEIAEPPGRRAVPEPEPSALKAVVVYAFCATLWIVLSDEVVTLVFNSPNAIHLASTLKGWLFVLVTSAVLYVLLRRLLLRVSTLTRREADAKADRERTHSLLIEILDNSSDAIFAKDLDGRYQLFNREAARVTGKDVSDVVGRDDHALFPAQQAAVVRANDHRVMEGNRTFTYEESLPTVDGEVVYLAIKAPLHDAQGRVSGMFGISRDITQRKRAEASARAARNQLQATLDALPDLLFEVGADLRIYSYHSPRTDLLATPPESFIGKDFTHLLPQEAATVCRSALKDARKAGYSAGRQYALPLPQGTRWFEASVARKPMPPGETERFIFLARDITARKNAEDELRIAAMAFESQQGMMVTDPRGTIVRVNRAFTQLTGYAAEEAVGSNPSLLHSGRNTRAFYESMWYSIIQTGYWQGEIWNRRKGGELYAEWLTISAIRADDGSVTHYLGSFSDITKGKEAQAEIHRLAYYDSLTNLPNRRLLYDRIEQVIATSTRSHSYNALLCMDIDHFKTLNDTRGHAVGDQLLIETAKRLQHIAREGDTVARLGGDEFVMVLTNLGDDGDDAGVIATAATRQVLRTLSAPYPLANGNFHCTASIGVKLFRNHGASVETVLKHADAAMYQAKAAGRNTLRFFDPAMQVSLERRATMESDLHKGLDEGQFAIYYQPQCDSEGRIIGAEALLRWDHPQRGSLRPDEFIPIAEETGLILHIGRWVLESVCAQLAAWAGSPVTGDLSIAVNVSALQFRQNDFTAQVRAALEASRARPQQLKLELTESVLVADMGDTFDKMQALQELGIGLSLDDFGTGSSSLSYLSRLPLEQLKIDKSFIANLAESHNDALIVQTIVAMAKGLGITVIAEGVETQSQFRFLEQLHCDAYQGFLFSRPLEKAEFEAYAAAHHAQSPGPG